MNESKRKLTDRQLREIEYHKKHAMLYKDRYKAIQYDVIQSKKKRWWNAYWVMYTILLNMNLNGKKVLVAGCGFGDDAFRISKMGADVYAFDLSPDCLKIAQKTAFREGLNIFFHEMCAEYLEYNDNFFDYVIARDILHHVDISRAMKEIARVSKNGAIFFTNEIYTHSAINRIRKSKIIEKWLYPNMVKFIYQGQKQYITEDERKITEHDIKLVKGFLTDTHIEYFNFFINRIIPDNFTFFVKMDRIVLMLLKPVAHFLAGRILFKGIINK